MKKKDFKKPGFSLDRSRRGDLACQVAAGLRAAIKTGFYKTGEILPPVRDLAEILEVSKGIAEQAVAMLREEGLISPRPAVGSVVLGRGGKLWRGNVLFVSRTCGYTYYDDVFTATLRARLVKAGWVFTQTAVPKGADGDIDVSELELHLTGQVTLAVVMFNSHEVVRLLSRAGVPFVSLGVEKSCRRKGCVGYVRYDRSKAVAGLVSAVRDTGVKTALQVGWEDFDDVGAALKSAGVRTSGWNVRIPPGAAMPSAVSFAVRDEFLRRLGSFKMPDLLYFSDDYACVGALAALTLGGVRIPEDVRVATWSNFGNEPVYGKNLTRMEMHPADDAEKFAAALLNGLEGRSGGFSLVLGPNFIKGDTL